MKLLVALLLLGSPLSAESGMDAPDMRVDSTASSIESLQMVIKELKENSANLKKELEKVKEENKKLKESGSAKNLEKALKELEDVKESLKSCSEELAVTKGELARMQEVKEQWFKQLIAAAQNDWLNRPFSAVDPAELEESLAVYERYASESAELEKSAGQLKALLENCRTFQSAAKALDEEYNPAEVNRLASWAKSLLGSETDAVRKQELADVFDKLDNYWARISMCQDLIRSIDDNIGGKGQSRWEGIVKDVIADEEENFATLTAINSIPWLKDQFEKYREAVLKKGSEPNEFRTRILGLKAE